MTSPSTNRFLSATIAMVALLASPVEAAEYRETRAATRFQIFVPPNNDQTARYSAVIVTAVAGTVTNPCVVDLIDDGSDGDTDDTLTGVSLVKGQSLVRYIKDGAVNDDYGSNGPWDGDYFTITSSLPVTAHVVTDSFWQHDWVPSDDGSLRGTSFFIYSNYQSRDVNAFAYEDGTRVSVYDITGDAPTTGSGVTSIGERAALPTLSVDLNAGEDMFVKYGLGGGLFKAGRTYQVVSTKPVTVMSGAISTNGIRDGGGFVPSATGATVGDDFLFTIPHDAGRLYEQELRVVSFDDGVVATLEGWDESAEVWAPIRTMTLDRLDHADQVGGTHRLFRLRATGGEIAVFEANWLETGAIGTSDIASFASGTYGVNGEQEFLVYLGPPGVETNTAFNDTLTHVYLFSKEAVTGVVIEDADTGGMIYSNTVDIPAGGMVDIQIDSQTYNAMDRTAEGIRPYLRISSGAPISVLMANWNDNWMAYASSVLTRNPEVILGAPETIEVGELTRLTGVVRNDGELTLTAAEITLRLPAGITSVQATLDGQAPLSNTNGPDGAEVIFAIGTMMPGDTVTLEWDVRADTATSGDLINVGANVTAIEGSEALASSDAVVMRVTDADVATITDLRAISEDGRVLLAWTASGSEATISVQVVQRSQAADGSYLELPGSVVTFQGNGAPQNMIFIDTDVLNGQDYYYRVAATGADGKIAYAGPVLGQPRDVTPPSAPTIAIADIVGQITLVSNTNLDTDVRGIIYERKLDGGTTWSRLNNQPTSPAAFTDGAIAIGQRYIYRARAVDWSGNASGWSAEVGATPLAPSDRTTTVSLGYEDMIGPGENDWDYNDFVVRVVAFEDYGTDGLEQLVVTYEPLARGAGYIHELRQNIELTGAWSATIETFDSANPGTALSQEVVDGSGTLDVAIYQDTRDALAPIVSNFSNTDARQGVYEAATHARLTVVLANPSANPIAPPAAPWDLYLHLPFLPPPNEVHRPEFGGASEMTGFHSDLSGRLLDFVIEFDGDTPNWPFEGYPIWHSYDNFIPKVRGELLSAPMVPRGFEAVFHKNRNAPQGICGNNLPDPDADLDGSPDCVDVCPNDANKADVVGCGCGVAEPDTCAESDRILVDDCGLYSSSCHLALRDCETSGDPSTCEASVQVCQLECPFWPACSGVVSLQSITPEGVDLILTASCQ